MRSWLKLAGSALLAVALLQCLLWYTVSREAAQLARDLRPMVELQYASTFAWLSGDIGLRGVRIQTPALPDGDVSAERVELDVGGPIGLLRLAWFDDDDAPLEDVSFAFRQLRLSAGLERMLRENASRQGYLAPYEALGCNDRGRFSGTDYAGLGWLQSVADVEMRIRHPRSGGQSWTFAYDMQPLGRMEFALDLSGDRGNGWVWSAIGSALRIDRAELRYTDRGMLAHRNAYCARQLNIDEAAFIDRHMAAVADELEADGIFPDDAVMALYRTFADDGGTLAMTVLPIATVALRDYRHYRAEDQLAMLNAGLRLDDGPMVPLKARFYSDGTGSGTSRAAPSATVRVKVDPRTADQLLFEELPDLVGRRLGVTMREGQDHVGTLLGTQGPLVRIEIVQRSGTTQRLALSRDSITAMRLLD